jgi:hypothetical protein
MKFVVANLVTPVLALVVLITLSACVPLQHVETSPVVIVERAIILDWGIRTSATGVTYQNTGIPGNLAFFPNTRNDQNETLKAVLLGNPLPPGERISIEILGVHEQISAKGLTSTVIVSTTPGQTLQTLEEQKSGALAVIEAGLVKLNGNHSRSLGFRSTERARQTIDQALEMERSAAL